MIAIAEFLFRLMLILLFIVSVPYLILLTVAILEEVWDFLSYRSKWVLLKLGCLIVECDYQIIVVNGYMGCIHTFVYFPFLGKYSFIKKQFAHCSCPLYLPESDPRRIL